MAQAARLFFRQQMFKTKERWTPLLYHSCAHTSGALVVGIFTLFLSKSEQSEAGVYYDPAMYGDQETCHMSVSG